MMRLRLRLRRIDHVRSQAHGEHDHDDDRRDERKDDLRGEYSEVLQRIHADSFLAVRFLRSSDACIAIAFRLRSLSFCLRREHLFGDPPEHRRLYEHFCRVDIRFHAVSFPNRTFYILHLFMQKVNTLCQEGSIARNAQN